MLAIDVAILLPPDVAERAIELSAQLPKEQSEGLLLGPEYLPHITLLQQFICTDDLAALFDRVGKVIEHQPAMPLRVTGGAMGSRSVWMKIEPAVPLVDLHTRILDAAQPFDRRVGDTSAFFGNDARDRDVQWVTTYRTASSHDRFRPHITLGHGSRALAIEPFTFEATTVAACHLGRFCSCRRVLREWPL